MVSSAAADCLPLPQRGSGRTHGIARLRFPAVAVLLWTAAAQLSLCYISLLQCLFADALLQRMRMQGDEGQRRATVAGTAEQSLSRI